MISRGECGHGGLPVIQPDDRYTAYEWPRSADVWAEHRRMYVDRSCAVSGPERG